MAATGPESSHAYTGPIEAPRERRSHTYSRLTTAIAVLGLATAGYALLRLDATRDRLDAVNDTVKSLESDRNVLRVELQNLAARERQARGEIDRRLGALGSIPQQVQELATSVEQLRGRAEGPQRAWSRAEAMFLVELAQRHIALNRDVETAIAALEGADARLASLRDASLAGVRQEIARELQALRAVRQPDIAGIVVRLAGAEEQALKLPVKGILAAERAPSRTEDLPEGMFARAWALTRRTLSDLIVVRRVDDLGGRVVSAEEALLRRQHLQLLIFSARTAVARHYESGYRTALARSRQWLDEYFDLSAAPVQSMLREVQQLEPLDIDPTLPDLSASRQALQRAMPARQGPE